MREEGGGVGGGEERREDEEGGRRRECRVVGTWEEAKERRVGVPLFSLRRIPRRLHRECASSQHGESLPDFSSFVCVCV